MFVSCAIIVYMIKKYKNSKGYTVKEMARFLSISEGMVKKLLSGRCPNISYRIAVIVHKKTGLWPYDYIGNLKWAKKYH